MCGVRKVPKTIFIDYKMENGHSRKDVRIV